MIKYEYELMALYKSAIEKEEEDKIKLKGTKDICLIEKLLREMNDTGYNIKYFADFNFRKFDDKKIILILKKYIGRFDNVGISAELINVLGQKGWNECTEFILEQIYNIDDINDMNYNPIFLCVDNALYRIKDKRYIKEYLKIIKNPIYAKNLGLLMLMLGKWKVEEAKEIYLNFIEMDDLELLFLTINALSYYNDKNLIEKIKPFLNSENKDMKKCAAKAIKKINKNIS